MSLSFYVFIIFPVAKAISSAKSTTQDGFSGDLFRNFEVNFFCFVVAICDLVHDVAISHLP